MLSHKYLKILKASTFISQKKNKYRDLVKKCILQRKKHEKTNQCVNAIEHASDNKRKKLNKIFLLFVIGEKWYFQ